MICHQAYPIQPVWNFCLCFSEHCQEHIPPQPFGNQKLTAVAPECDVKGIPLRQAACGAGHWMNASGLYLAALPLGVLAYSCWIWLRRRPWRSLYALLTFCNSTSIAASTSGSRMVMVFTWLPPVAPASRQSLLYRMLRYSGNGFSSAGAVPCGAAVRRLLGR